MSHEEDYNEEQSFTEELNEYFPHVHVWDPYADLVDEYEYLEEEAIEDSRKAATRKMNKLQARESELRYEKPVQQGKVKATRRDRLDLY